MNDTLKKIIAGAVVGGSLASGTLTAVDRANCDYELAYEGTVTCVSQEEVDAIRAASGTWQSVQTWDE